MFATAAIFKSMTKFWVKPTEKRDLLGRACRFYVSFRRVALARTVNLRM